MQEAMRDPSKIKVSLRSIGDEDTTQLSQHFGGGGHKHASSFIIDIQDFESWRLWHAMITKHHCSSSCLSSWGLAIICWHWFLSLKSQISCLQCLKSAAALPWMMSRICSRISVTALGATWVAIASDAFSRLDCFVHSAAMISAQAAPTWLCQYLYSAFSQATTHNNRRRHFQAKVRGVCGTSPVLPGWLILRLQLHAVSIWAAWQRLFKAIRPTCWFFTVMLSALIPSLIADQDTYLRRTFHNHLHLSAEGS